MILKKNLLNVVFVGHLVFFGLLIAGILPRSLVLYETELLALYLFLASLDEGLIFFLRCIPLFVAIPLTANFDNFNQWRIFAAILFLKFLVSQYQSSAFRQFSFKQWFKQRSVSLPLMILLLLAVASVIPAGDKVAAIRRIIYFVNAALIGIVMWRQTRVGAFAERVIKNIAVPTIIALIVAVIQVAATYLIDIYQFMRIWGEGIQMRQFGTEWSYIATHVGNTWFAYYGEQLSLRVFSLFPDSHSFPIFILLGLPALFAISVKRPLEKVASLKQMFHTRGSLQVLWIPLVFLMVILSGTRGMWLAGVGAIVWSLLLWGFLRWQKQPKEKRNVFIYISSFLALFVLLFAVAYPILSSPQFLVSKPDALLLEHRLRSVLDFGETSNAARIAIWKASAKSIISHPILGVGIGNFPVVLDQNIKLTRAGSSAHNIYIHVAAEMGLAAFIIVVYLLWLMIQKLYRNYLAANTDTMQAYTAGLLITLPWILAYLMTDVALFDERALLLFAVTLGLMFRKNG
jgi:O-antigen ligase